MLSFTNRRIIAIAPHIDDVELGAGATVPRLAPRTNEVHYVGLSLPPLVDVGTSCREFRGELHEDPRAGPQDRQSCATSIRATSSIPGRTSSSCSST